VEIRHLYISAGHNFFGHHGKTPDNHPAVEVSAIDCVAARGIKNDRFFDYRDDYKGQITFFSLEVFDELCAAFHLPATSPAAVRRNVIVSGIDLNSLIGSEFEVQGVRFQGASECKPCYWMDQAIAPGAEKFLRGRGGLRARILTNGRLVSAANMPAPGIE
jgi:MOSC domain-containing protein YiiM